MLATCRIQYVFVFRSTANGGSHKEVRGKREELGPSMATWQGFVRAGRISAGCYFGALLFSVFSFRINFFKCFAKNKCKLGGLK